MSYDVYVDDKSIVQVASNSGWYQTARYLASFGGKESKDLADYGFSADLKTLGTELDKLVALESTPADIKSVLVGIQSAIRKGKNHVGIGQEGPTQVATKATESIKLAELKPHEKKHNFEGHAKRQDATATAIRRIIAGAKPSLIREAARRAAPLEVKHLDTLTLPFDRNLAARIAKAVSIAYKYGKDQVYAERYRATGRPASARSQGKFKYRLHNRTQWQGLDVSIENEKGTIREGKDRDGVAWVTIMHHPYGYLRRKGNVQAANKGKPTTEGNDAEHLDVYLGPDKKAIHVYIVHQNDPTTGQYDEDKCFLDFTSAEDAKRAYLQHIPEAWFGSMTTMTVEEFKQALEDNDGRLHLKHGKQQEAVTLSEKSAKQDQPHLIAEAAVSDLNNSLTARTRSIAVDLRKQGLTDQELEDELRNELIEGTDAYLDRIANEAARSGVAGGRYAAFEELADEIRSYVRSEAMDKSTCGPCEQGDGTEWESLEDVSWAPGDDCEGEDLCRGQLLPIFSDEGVVEVE